MQLWCGWEWCIRPRLESYMAASHVSCGMQLTWDSYYARVYIVESYVAAYYVSCGAQPYRDSMCFHCSPSSCPDTQYDVSVIRKRRMMSA